MKRMITLAIAIVAIITSALAVTIEKPTVGILGNVEKRVAVSSDDIRTYGNVYYVAIDECDSVSEIKRDSYDYYVEVNGRKVRVDENAAKANKVTHYEVVAGDICVPVIEYVVCEPDLSGKKIRVKKLIRKYNK